MIWSPKEKSAKEWVPKNNIVALLKKLNEWKNVEII